MNIILRELKSIRRSLIIWSSSIIFLIYVGMIKYEGYSKVGETANELFDTLPIAVKAVLGIGNMDLALASGYYVVFFLYFSVIGGIHAIMQGAIVLSKEERDKTADFLMVKPVKRSYVIHMKIIASLISIAIINVVTWIGSIVVVDIFNKGPSINNLISKLMIGLLMIQLIYFSLGLLFSVLMKSTKKAASVSSGFLLSTFLLSIIIDINHNLESIKYLTPFKYFDGKRIYFEGLSDFSFLLAFLVIIIAFAISYYIYDRKDLHV